MCKCIALLRILIKDGKTNFERMLSLIIIPNSGVMIIFCLETLLFLLTTLGHFLLVVKSISLVKVANADKRDHGQNTLK